MKGKRFDTILFIFLIYIFGEIKEKSKQKLLAIPKSAFQNCFEDWKKRWHKCIISKRGCFDGDKIVIDK